MRNGWTTNALKTSYTRELITGQGGISKLGYRFVPCCILWDRSECVESFHEDKVSARGHGVRSGDCDLPWCETETTLAGFEKWGGGECSGGRCMPHTSMQIVTASGSGSSRQRR